MTKQKLLSKLRTLLKNRQYRIRSHVVRHMIEEGFGEEDILESLWVDVGFSKIIPARLVV